jgi:hypothetical protein
MKRSVLLLVPVLLVAALAVPASASGAGWSITPSPNPQVPTAQLFWVSCPAADWCMAVGTYTKSSGPGVNLAERWNGHSWRVLPIPNPPGAVVSNLVGVSCTSPSACTAVGTANPFGSTAKTLAERWNGIKWSIQATPSPPRGGLSAVSCTSASACTAVGASGAGTLAESWNGARWTVQATPNPKRGGGFLSGVSCTSASVCTAVGASDPFTPTAKTLAERWNGTRWSIQATPNPSQGGGELLSVSCVSASACTATGNSNAGTLGAQWNGAGWSLRPTPSPVGSPFTYLNSVACTSPSACTAVGAYQTSSGAFRTLAARWNGTAWHRQATPSPTGTSVLIGVACASGTACTAVGYTPTAQTPAAVAEQWNGSTWKAESAPSPLGAASSNFNGVACAAPSACIAVGGTTSRARAQVSLAERWDGHSWRIQPIPSPASGGVLIGVSCASASACTAVGAAHPNAPGATTLAERWNGTRWSIQATPGPAGVAAAALVGVSCTSGSACMAAGTAFNSSGSPMGLFSERWDGTRWHLQTAPMPTGSAGSFFAGVACTSPSACIAVGARTDSSGNPVGTLAERWNGTRWSIQLTPNPPPGGVLAAVSCRSMTACTAAGNLNGTASAGTTTLVERWNGSAWAVQPTPKLSAGQGSFFNGVACKASACTAVGLYLTPAGPLTLAERWTGTGWRIQATPTPSQAYDIAPPAVACPAVSACMAVGGYTTNTPNLTLAEQWNGTGQSALLAKRRLVALGTFPAACPRALLLRPSQGSQRTPASPQRWARERRWSC